MSTIVTRSGKGSPLTNTELDANFTNLNNDKIQTGSTVAALTITDLVVSNGLTVDTNTLKVDNSNNRVGILDATPAVSLDIGSATDAIHVPTGTTGQRPTGAAGMFRYNTTDTKFEGYSGGSWSEIGGGGATISVDNFTGNGSTTAFTLGADPLTENNTDVYIDGVYQFKNTYAVSGTTLTFSTAPPNGSLIEVSRISASAVSVGTPDDNTVSTVKIQNSAVTTAKIADSTGASDGITTAKVADNAITLAKMASGTDGNIISYDANGDPVAVATGNAGQVLTSAGAGSPPTFADAGGAYTGWSIKTSAYTASAGDQLIVNSASAVTITLPASPSVGDTVVVKARGGGTVTIGRNSSNFESGTADGTLPSGNKTQVVYINSTIGWEEL